jgi:hypothetical protein
VREEVGSGRPDFRVEEGQWRALAEPGIVGRFGAVGCLLLALLEAESGECKSLDWHGMYRVSAGCGERTDS